MDRAWPIWSKTVQALKEQFSQPLRKFDAAFLHWRKYPQFYLWIQVYLDMAFNGWCRQQFVESALWSFIRVTVVECLRNDWGKCDCFLFSSPSYFQTFICSLALKKCFLPRNRKTHQGSRCLWRQCKRNRHDMFNSPRLKPWDQKGKPLFGNKLICCWQGLWCVFSLCFILHMRK